MENDTFPLKLTELPDTLLNKISAQSRDTILIYLKYQKEFPGLAPSYPEKKGFEFYKLFHPASVMLRL